MFTLETYLTGHELRMRELPGLASGSVRLDRVHFIFDSAWDGLTKVALFWGADSDTPFGAVVDAEGYAIVPWEVLEEKSIIRFGVYGTGTDTRLTSTLIRYKVQQGAWSEEIGNSGDPTPTMIEQFEVAAQAAIDAAQAVADQAKQIADNVTGNLAADYSAQATYALGAFCIQNGVLYRCTTAITTPEAWNASHWTVAPVGDELVAMKATTAAAQTSVDNAQADVDDLKSAVSESSEALAVTQGLSVVTDVGVTATYHDSSTIKIYGTSTGARRILCLNGQALNATTKTPFSKTIDAGWYDITMSVTGHLQENVSIQGTYTTFADMTILVDKYNNPAHSYRFSGPVMLGISFGSGANFGTENDPTYISVSAVKTTAVDNYARDSIAETTVVANDAKVLGLSSVLFTEAQNLTDEQETTARDNIDSVGNDTLYEYNFYDALALGNMGSNERNGVTYTKNDDGTWTINGTASGQSFGNIIQYPTEIPRYIIPGRKYRFAFHGGAVPIKLFIYKNGSIDTAETYTNDFVFTFPEDMGGLIVRYQVDDGMSFTNATVKYELIPEMVTSIDNHYTYNITTQKTENVYNNTYDISTTPSITTDTNGWLAASGDHTDRTADIMAMLNATGYCHLGEGFFYISGNIDMPVNSKLCGCGRKTILRLLDTTTSGYCVKMQSYNTISDVTFRGGTSVDISSQGARTAILFAANHDGTEGATQSDTQQCMLNNVWIDHFTDSGLKCHNTSINVSKGLYAVNVYVSDCWAGINIDYVSEFNKFCNVCTYSCKYGCINNGGNNVFTNCTFHASSVGFYIDGTKDNSGHGTINGCTFCHVGSNTGSAITMHDVQNGFIISDSQIWYCSIDITDCSGIAFNGCEFGRGIVKTVETTAVGATININGGNLIMFDGCVFMNDVLYPPEFDVTNNTKVRVMDCYGSASGNAITPYRTL